KLSSRIPAITHGYGGGARSALLMTVAGGGLLEAETLVASSGGRLNFAVQKVSESLLRGWNPNPAFKTEGICSNLLLREWLDHRLGRLGRIPDLFSSVLRVSPDCLSFRYLGEDYPNPFGFAFSGFPGNSITVSPARGLVHGDLHAENILISG